MKWNDRDRERKRDKEREHSRENRVAEKDDTRLFTHMFTYVLISYVCKQVADMRAHWSSNGVEPTHYVGVQAFVGLTNVTLQNVIKCGANAQGLTGKFSSHSPRRGAAQSLDKAGVAAQARRHHAADAPLSLLVSVVQPLLVPSW